MFLYELITLRQPFEGHETVKESILEGSRPVFTLREVMFPSYCLDLMVLCWDQQPKVSNFLAFHPEPRISYFSTRKHEFLAFQPGTTNFMKKKKSKIKNFYNFRTESTIRQSNRIDRLCTGIHTFNRCRSIATHGQCTGHDNTIATQTST